MIKFITQSEHHQINCSEYENYLEDFNQTIILFCFIVFFSASCPLTPLLVFILGFINKNYDAYKFFNVYRTNNLAKSDGVGIYNDLLSFFYYIGILTNISAVIFANPNLADMKLYVKFGILLGFTNLMLILTYVINIDLHPRWFDNLFIFKNGYKKQYLERRKALFK